MYLFKQVFTYIVYIYFKYNLFLKA